MLLQLVMAWAVLFPQVAEDPLAAYRQAATQRWEADIRELEQLDQREQDPAQAVLFLGSSSIRRWETIAQDMAPYAVIRRGYGGAKFSDLAVFAKRLVTPHRFAAAAIFVGNDITGGPGDKTPAEVLRLVRLIVADIREHQPQAPIFFIAVTPTRSRFAAWKDIQQLNAALAEYCQSEPQLHFIATADAFLNDAGQPIDEYFVADQLHLNSQGYQVWAAKIKAAFAKVLPPPQ